MLSLASCSSACSLSVGHIWWHSLQASVLSWQVEGTLSVHMRDVLGAQHFAHAGPFLALLLLLLSLQAATQELHLARCALPFTCIRAASQLPVCMQLALLLRTPKHHYLASWQCTAGLQVHACMLHSRPHGLLQRLCCWDCADKLYTTC